MKPITAQTPNTFIRKVWEFTQKDGAAPFVIISAWRSIGWAVSKEDLNDPTGRNGYKHPLEYVGDPDPAKDLQINQAQDAKLRQIVQNLRLKAIPLNGLGQEIDDKGNPLPESSERSYLISGVSRAQGESLDRTFNQDFFIAGQSGEPTLLIGWDRGSDSFFEATRWEGLTTYKTKSVGPDGEYQGDTPTSAQYRSDAAKAPGVGYVFYNAEDAADTISTAVDRMRAKGLKNLPAKAGIERAWISFAGRAEDAAKTLREAGDEAGAEKAEQKFKQLAAQVARDPEGMVRYLVGDVMHMPEALTPAVDEVTV